MCAGKLGLKVEPAHFRQAHIEHQATHRVGSLALQEFPRRGEDLAPEPDRPITDLKPSRDIDVVVHHEDHGFGVDSLLLHDCLPTYLSFVAPDLPIWEVGAA